MKSSKTGSVTANELTQYLLGGLKGEDRERLDELSITNDDFNERLSAAENDLVDAYVRGGLRNDVLEYFESHYLATDVRRQKVALARALFLTDARPDSSGEPSISAAWQDPRATLSWRSMMWLPNLHLGWVFMAAAVALAVTTAWLAVENYRLREQDQASLAANIALEEQLRQLRTQIQTAPTLQNSPAPAEENTGLRNMDQAPRLISSLFLLPPTRGAGTIPVASVSERDRWLRLQLALESDEFSDYQVNLMDLVGNRYVWHSGRVKSTDVNRKRGLSLLVPVGQLKTDRYAAEVSGITADQRREELGSYVFRISQAAAHQGERR